MNSQRFFAAFAICSLAALTGCPLGTNIQEGPNGNDTPGMGEKIMPAPGNNVIPATPVASELQGQWSAVLTYVPGFYLGRYIPVGDFTGSIGVSYYFGADGQYQYDLNTAKAGGFCIRTTGWTEWGTMSVAGADVSLSPVRATHVVTDSCGDFELDDNAPTAASTITVTPDQDAAGWPMLRLRLPSGEELLLEKCRDCQ